MKKRRRKGATEEELAAAEAAPAAETAAEPAGETAAVEPLYAAALEAKVKELHKTAGFCGLCAGVLRSFASHASRRPACKSHPGSRKLTPEEWEQLKSEVEEEFANPLRAKEVKVQAAKERHAQQWKPPDAGSQAEQEYKLDFGKHSGKTIQEVLAKDAKYFIHLASWKNKIFQESASLGKALQKEGLLESLLNKRPELQVERAQRIVAKVAEETKSGKELHPEIKKLRLHQQIEASQILDSEDKQEALALVPLQKASCRKRKYKPQPKVLLPHCSICGDTTHKRQTCPFANLQGEGIPERTAVVMAHLQDKKKAAVTSRLKCAQIQLRSQKYESRPSHTSRAPVHRSFLAYSRAQPSEMAQMLEEDGLVWDLKGVPCPRQKCADNEASDRRMIRTRDGARAVGLTSNKLLGKRCTNDSQGKDIHQTTVWHSCDSCRTRQSIALHNPIFEGFIGGGGSYGISYAVMAMWNAVEGVAISITVRMLNISEGLCQQYYHRAYVIMAWGARRRQKLIVWGTGTSKTVEVEVDATVICRWRVVEHGTLVYYYYCYIGARQRGNMDNLALMPLGISRSENQGRVNPESSEAYRKFCKEVFGVKRHGLLSVTDGANTYKCRCQQCKTIFEAHYSVNHSRQPVPEFSRPEPAVPADIETDETRASIITTNTLDAEWGFCKGPLPKNLEAKTEGQIQRTDILVRAQQFRRMVSTGDRWAAFLEEARLWANQKSAAKATQASVGKFASQLAAKRNVASSSGKGAGVTDGNGEVPLSPAEAQALQGALQDATAADAEAAKAMPALQGALQDATAADAEAAKAMPEFVLSNSNLWRHVEGFYNIPPDVMEALHSGLAQVYDEASADALFMLQWLCDCSDLWAELAAAVHSQPELGEGVPALPGIFDEFVSALFRIQRLALQNSEQFGNLGKTDEQALSELALGELSFVLSKSPGDNNNCLIWSLAQGLAYQGWLDFGSNQAQRCQNIRKKLIATPGLHPREANGQKNPMAFLQHHLHAKKILSELLGELPAEGIQVIVHTRWCTPQSPPEALTFSSSLGPEAPGGGNPAVTIHLFNRTGRGTGGYHYDLLMQ
jgi:hypothetical protein